MHFAFLGAAVLFIVTWTILFVIRKDLRKEMLVMSLIATPLGLFDLWAVPLYWQPQTLYNIPVGIEGLLYSFALGGITAVLYSEVAHKRLQQVHKYHKTAALIVFAATAAIFLPLALAKVANPAVIIYIALLSGIGVTLYFRKDLVKSALIGAFCFGILYFVLIKIWLLLFPDAVDWFVFQGLPPVRLLGVPMWELLFGIIFAAYWGNLYQLIFGYKLAARSKKK